MNREEVLDELARLFRKRKGGCPVLLGVELASAGSALGLTQADIEEAQRRAEAVEPPRSGG